MDKMQEKVKDGDFTTQEANQIRQSIENGLVDKLQKFFRPEFLNRLDNMIVFNPLSDTVLKKIIEIQINKYVKRLEKEKDIILDITDNAKDFLAKM
jgi:ATP-dependent Clp protease ATP-binding subunit ClpA